MQLLTGTALAPPLIPRGDVGHIQCSLQSSHSPQEPPTSRQQIPSPLGNGSFLLLATPGPDGYLSVKYPTVQPQTVSCPPPKSGHQR